MPDPILEISKETADAKNISDGEWVEINTRVGTFVARAKMIKDIEPGSVFAQHGWWGNGAENTPSGADKPTAVNMNRAIDTALSDPISGSISLRNSYCNVKKMKIDDRP
jgi:anaerobic selenocysteine-containing dehydrogenase